MRWGFAVWGIMAALIAVLGSTGPVKAGDLAAPDGQVILRVTGAIGRTNAPDAALFDRAMIAALPAVTFETTTIWTEGVQRFKGVSLSHLLDVLDVSGKTLKATAINDYAVEIPVADAVQGGPILAYELNGNAMTVRNKGPLWIVYSYDANPDYRAETIYARSIWQLDRIEVTE